MYEGEGGLAAQGGGGGGEGGGGGGGGGIVIFVEAVGRRTIMKWRVGERGGEGSA
jgi:hypothetical protein